MINRKLFAFISRTRALFFSSVLLSLLGGGLTIANAYQLSQVINEVFLEGANLADVSQRILWLLAINLGRGLALFGAEASAQLMAKRVKRELRDNLIKRILRLGPAFVGRESSAELSTTVLERVEGLEAYFAEYLPQIIKSALIPLTVLVVAFSQDRLTGLILLLTAPLIPFFMILIGKRTTAVNLEQWETLSRLSTHFLDVIQGLRTLKDLGRSREQAVSIRLVSDDYAQSTLKVLRVAFLSALALELLATLSTAVIAVEIGLRLLNGLLPFASALFLLILAPEFYLPLRNLGARFHAGADGVAAAKRIHEIMEMPLPRSTETKQTAPNRVEKISFEEISFEYPQAGIPAIKHLSFELQRGERLGLLGPNGAGKSTLVKLLLGFVEPTEGQIKVNGAPLSAMDMQTWRRAIAWVPQFPSLFQGTLAENIALSKPDASQPEITLAARNAGIHDFIQSLPKGYQYQIGESGLDLSGGQRQRMALARAFLRDAELIILDEASAHLDPELDEQLQESIQRLTIGRSAILIAHRMSTIKHCDKLLMLEAGKRRNYGTREELMPLLQSARQGSQA